MSLFQPGHKLATGRPVGSQNKLTQYSAEEIKKALKEKGIDYINAFWGAWQKINDNEIKAELALRFMEFIHPKQRHLQMTMNLEDAIKTVEDAIAESGQTPITIEATPSSTIGTDSSNESPSNV